MPEWELIPDWVPPGKAMTDAVSLQFPGLTSDQLETTAGIVLGRVVKGISEGKQVGVFDGPFPDGSFEAEVLSIQEVIGDVLRQPRSE
jgi:hypothetical protein